MRNLMYLFLALITFSSCRSNDQSTELQLADTLKSYREHHRPQLHFSPREKWMNDPNGMVYYKGEYHLFYQYHPDGLVWGPMHWGHAVSKDLIHWTHLPIALYPDNLGLVFSGSAVVDENNTSGFGTKENPPLVAVFTYHSLEKERAGEKDYQSQGIAYSTDSGRTWTKYEKNPVLKNQGIPDFRDPKVFWHEQSKKWVMILAVKDHVELWGSPDLKSWNKLSDFGSDYGAHGGVWECPDLFFANIEGESSGKWAMLVSINPGAPNGGSATQYFVGEFDGTTFKPDTDKRATTWLDYGPDNYAGITWANAPGGRHIFIGWMSNWAYAQELPTRPWRGVSTIARDLKLTRVDGKLQLASNVVPELSDIVKATNSIGNLDVNGSTDVNTDNRVDFSRSLVSGSFEAKDFTIELQNSLGQELTIGFDQKNNRFFINRSQSGKTDFSKNFRTEAFAPRVSTANKINLTFVADVSSIEVFFDDGITVMTSVFYPDQPLSKMKINSPQALKVEKLEVKQLNSIWETAKSWDKDF